MFASFATATAGCVGVREGRILAHCSSFAMEDLAESLHELVKTMPIHGLFAILYICWRGRGASVCSITGQVRGTRRTRCKFFRKSSFWDYAWAFIQMTLYSGWSHYDRNSSKPASASPPCRMIKSTCNTSKGCSASFDVQPGCWCPGMYIALLPFPNSWLI